MPELVKATLTEIDGNVADPRDLSAPMDVQLNPSSLRLSLFNQSDGGKTLTRPQHQYLGSGARSLSLELVFDTADEGTTGRPRPVTEKTALVERFVLPRRSSDGSVDPPPRVRFSWGSLTVEGVVDTLGIDIDHFAADGTPLRARCSLSIREQDATLKLRESSSAGRWAGQAPTPTAAAEGSLGVSGGLQAGASARVGVAIGGESLVDFSARMGLDPGAWRDLGAGLDGTLSLEAGAEIGFSASASVGPGLGLSGGLSAGASTSLGASFGVDVGADLKVGASAWGGIDTRLDGGAAGWSGSGAAASASVSVGTTSGLGLSEAGGLSAAIESVKMVYAQAGARAARSAFSDPAAVPVSGVSATVPVAGNGTVTGRSGAAVSATRTATGAGDRRGGATASAAVPSAAGTSAPLPRPGPPEQSRTPLKDTGFPVVGTRAAPAPAPPRADPRAVSFGLGVPLRPTWGEAARSRAGGGLGLPPVTDDPQVPPWRALPAAGAGSGEAERDRRRSALDCLCVCPPRRRGPGSF